MSYSVWPTWCRRLGWFVIIWLLSVAALGLMAYFLRFIMAGLGMTS